MKFYNGGSSDISKRTVGYNLTAFNHGSAFGCGQRMGLMIYPVIAYNSFYKIDKSKLKILIVGCRTEDDIFWMRAYGFSQTFGLDLFSYSKYIWLGDIHGTDFPDESFDVILLGWMIAYSKEPKTVVKECRRILKTGGLLGIGLEYLPTKKTFDKYLGEIPNTLNTTADIISLIDSVTINKVIFEYDHYNQKSGDYGVSIISICK